MVGAEGRRGGGAEGKGGKGNTGKGGRAGRGALSGGQGKAVKRQGGEVRGDGSMDGKRKDVACSACIECEPAKATAACPTPQHSR